MKEYISKADGVYKITGSRISLDSIVIEFLRGASPESIQRSFPALTLEEVYGAITYYLANQSEIDEYLKIGDIDFAKLAQKSNLNYKEWYERLKAARADALVS